tara:strand:- start:327 stop:1049 length:723 start_codon:yes stop_codon:yes gene_type:complete
MKIIGMIPARMGSQRVKRKNLRLLNGKPLVEYIFDAASKADYLDEIYINSEDQIFEDIASPFGIKFYKRDPFLAGEEATNDHFAFDFLRNMECDILIQLLPTSPFITTQDINSFIEYMLKNNLETLTSVEPKQIGCIYEDKPVNFDTNAILEKSQNLKPVLAYTGALMGWNRNKFIENMDKHGCAYHGNNTILGHYEWKGLSTIDIDNEEDFLLADKLMKALEYNVETEPRFYSKLYNKD